MSEQSEWMFKWVGSPKRPRQWCYDNRIKHRRVDLGTNVLNVMPERLVYFTFFKKEDATLFRMFWQEAEYKSPILTLEDLVGDASPDRGGDQ